ncbi:MAG: hypothetical protein ACKVHU_13490 [Acidimicrobiales bacterium]|jgi:hypothetical protein
MPQERGLYVRMQVLEHIEYLGAASLAWTLLRPRDGPSSGSSASDWMHADMA